MKKFTVNWTLNIYGADTAKLLYAGLNSTYSSLGLTQTNSKITLVQPYGDPTNPKATIIRIELIAEPRTSYEFIYDRVDINTILPVTVLSAADIVLVKAMTDSAKVLDFIAKKYNRAFTPKDFWVSIGSIEYTGGKVTPNWLMRNRYDSLCWYNKRIVQIH